MSDNETIQVNNLPSDVESKAIAEAEELVFTHQMNTRFKPLEDLIATVGESGIPKTISKPDEEGTVSTASIPGEVNKILTIVAKDSQQPDKDTPPAMNKTQALRYMDKLYKKGEDYFNRLKLDPDKPPAEQVMQTVNSFLTAYNKYAERIFYQSPNGPDLRKCDELLSSMIKRSQDFGFHEEVLSYANNQGIINDLRALQSEDPVEAQLIYIEQIRKTLKLIDENKALREAHPEDKKLNAKLMKDEVERSSNVAVYWTHLSRVYLYNMPSLQDRPALQTDIGNAADISFTEAVRHFEKSESLLGSVIDQSDAKYNEIIASIKSNLAYSYLLEIDYLLNYRPDRHHELPQMVATYVDNFRQALEIFDADRRIFLKLKSETTRRTGDMFGIFGYLQQCDPELFEQCFAHEQEFLRSLWGLFERAEADFPITDMDYICAAQSFYGLSREAVKSSHRDDEEAHLNASEARMQTLFGENAFTLSL